MNLAALWLAHLLTATSTPEPPPDMRQGILFASLDRLDATDQASAAMGLLFDRKQDGVPLRLALSFSTSRPLGDERHYGLYGTFVLTKLTGAERSNSAVSNLDLGLFHNLRLGQAGWFILRGGVLLPTGDADDTGAALNASVAAQRLADAVLFQPAAFGARTSASLVLLPSCERCALRLDVGVDVYSLPGLSFRAEPRWGAGVGRRADRFTLTLEYTGARYPDALGAPATVHHAVGGSLRVMPPANLDFIQPGLSVSVPLGEPHWRWFLGLDMTLRFPEGKL